MSEKKYEVLESISLVDEWNIYHAIIALKDFGDVKKGDMGGWVCGNTTIADDGDCWVYPDAKVCNGIICDNAKLYKNAKVICDEYERSVLGGNTIMKSGTVYDTCYLIDCVIKGKKTTIDKCTAYSSEFINSDIRGVCHIKNSHFMKSSILNGGYIANSTLDDLYITAPCKIIANEYDRCGRIISYPSAIDSEMYYANATQSYIENAEYDVPRYFVLDQLYRYDNIEEEDAELYSELEISLVHKIESNCGLPF